MLTKCCGNFSLALSNEAVIDVHTLSTQNYNYTQVVFTLPTQIYTYTQGVL